MKIRFILISLAATAVLFAASTATFAAPSAATPAPIVIDTYGQPIGNVHAPKGGTLNLNLGFEPSTLNPLFPSDGASSRIRSWIIESLMYRDLETYQWVPGLAEKLEVSPDRQQFTFTLRKGVKFHDGVEMTAADVKFSFDAIFDDRFKAASQRPDYEAIEKVVIVNDRTIRFIAKKKYFAMLDRLANLAILPKHIFDDPEKAKKMNKSVIGTGPYKFASYDQGQSIVLVRNKDWWGNSVDYFAGAYDADRLRLRFVMSEDITLEMLKKGDLDFLGMGEQTFMQRAVGPEWGKSVFKVKTQDLIPSGTTIIAWNLRRPLFQDRDVRHALQALLNRQEMLKKFTFGMSRLATGPWDRNSEYADPDVKEVAYDPGVALKLLKKAGWSDSDKDGVLDKIIDGKKVDFRFTFFSSAKDFEKYLVVYQSDLKKVGIDMQIQYLEWNSFIKQFDEGKFDAACLSMGGGVVDIDPKSVWHSDSQKQGGLFNVGYVDHDVDHLIDEAREEFDKPKRVKILREAYRKIAADYPMAFFFNSTVSLYGYSGRVKMTKPTLPYSTGTDYWWIAP